MILRGASVSLNPVRVAVEEHRPAPRQDIPSPALVAQMPADPRSTITIERVQDWLAAQNADARRAIAAALATEIEAEYGAARERGWSEGREEARARAKVESAAQVASIEGLVTELRAAFERDAAALGEQCCEIVMEALRKIAGPILGAPAAVTGAVAQVLQRLKDGQEVLVRVRPDELATLHAAEPALARALAGATFTLVGDERVELGGCIVESKVGHLDGRLEVQLNELCETLRAAKVEARSP
jgi:flagellar biosynthesis/type III secretory pathway protein FliH